MLFFGMNEEMPTPTTLRPGDKVVVTRSLFKPLLVHIQVLRPVGKDEYFARAKHMPQGERWPRWYRLLIGANQHDAQFVHRLFISGERSLTDQVTNALRDMDPTVHQLKWRRLGFLLAFIHRAEFVAELRSSD